MEPVLRSPQITPKQDTTEFRIRGRQVGTESRQSPPTCSSISYFRSLPSAARRPNVLNKEVERDLPTPVPIVRISRKSEKVDASKREEPEDVKHLPYSKKPSVSPEPTESRPLFVHQERETSSTPEMISLPFKGTTPNDTPKPDIHKGGGEVTISAQVHSLYLRAKCKMLDVISTRLLESPHCFDDHDMDVWILGKRHRWRPIEWEDEEDRTLCFNAILNDLRSRVWITYRKNFPPIRDFTGISAFTSDSGWGCMIRTTQMLMANALVLHTLTRAWMLRKDKRQGVNYKQTLRYFVDLPNSRCILSIHNMMKNGMCFKKPAGVWFTPSETLHMATEALNSSSLKSVVSLVARDGIVYLDEVRRVCSRGNWWRSLILLIPLRLGLDNLLPSYAPALLKCLELPWSLGFVGGKPNRSLYFVGKHGNRVLFLDPHVTREAVTLETDFGEINPDYHCDKVNSLQLSELDPSIGLGFYIRDEKSFEKFWEVALEFKKEEFPLFSCEREKPSYANLPDWSEETHTSANMATEQKSLLSNESIAEKRQGTNTASKRASWVFL